MDALSGYRRAGYIFIVLFACCLAANAQQDYSATLIPKDLLPYASAVVRNEETTIEVKDLDEVIYHFKKAVTILNKNGDEQAEIVLEHGKSYNIKYIKGVVFDEFGKPVNKFSESAFQDVSEQDGFSLFLDSKIEYFRPAATSYPYTVEYEYELKAKESLLLRDWDPDPETGVSVEKSSFLLTCKPDFTLKYKEINLPQSVSVSTDKDGLKTYSCQVNDLKAVKNEPFSPNHDKYLGMLKLSPVKFIYGGIAGSYTNWNELGKWIDNNLLVNRQTIPASTTEEIQQITTGITDPKLKAKRIYEYMQNKTHYVNVSIGAVGGFQPIPASDVDKLNYGDCKALVNYSQALLKAVNIDSYYCIVMANDKRKISLMSDFASMDQANHIILCIPFKNDTTWCDCTSQTIPFGYLGDFTDDRTVLAITPQGGKLLHTPKYTAQDNLEQRKANFVLNADGEISGDMITIFKGVDYYERQEEIDESQSEKVKDIQKVYPINNMDVKKLVYTQDKSLDPVTTENIELKAPEYASIENNRVIFSLNTINRLYHAPKDVLNRKEDVYINEGYTETDDISYTLPAGYRMDSLPLNVSIKNQFGSFTASSTIKDGKLIYNRRLQVIDGTYPKDSYQDLVDFFQQVVDADASEVILQKTAN